MPEGDESFDVRAGEVAAWLFAHGMDVSRPANVNVLVPSHPAARAALVAWLLAAYEGLTVAA
jgi:hypothetical protein